MTAEGRQSSSSRSSRTVPLQHRVDVDEFILDRNLHIVLRDMTLRAEVSAGRNRSQELPFAIGEVGNADHRRLGFANTGSRMTRQTFVGVDTDLIPLRGVRNDGRLLRIIPGLAHRRVLFGRHPRWWPL